MKSLTLFKRREIQEKLAIKLLVGLTPPQSSENCNVISPCHSLDDRHCNTDLSTVLCFLNISSVICRYGYILYFTEQFIIRIVCINPFDLVPLISPEQLRSPASCHHVKNNGLPLCGNVSVNYNLSSSTQFQAISDLPDSCRDLYWRFIQPASVP